MTVKQFNMFLFLVLVSGSFFQITYAQKCTGTESFGDAGGQGSYTSTDSTTQTAYLLTAEPIPCCGKISRVQIVPNVAVASTIYFQVWRLQTLNYELVGEMAISVPANDDGQTTTYLATSSISVVKDDLIGWWSTTANIVKYKGGGDATVSVSMPTRAAVGTSVDWSTGSSVTRNNALKVEFSAGNGPLFTTPAAGSTFSYFTEEPTSTVVTTAAATDADINDVLKFTMTGDARFSIDSSTGQVTISSSLAGPSGSVALTITVEDRCENSATLAITITLTNRPPTINNMPDAITISEDTSVKTQLFTIDATDTVDTVTCSKNAGSSALVSVEQIPSTSPASYGIYVLVSPGFDYATQKHYRIDVDCTDTYTPVSSYFLLDLVKNNAPVITNLQGKAFCQKLGPYALAMEWYENTTSKVPYHLRDGSELCTIEISDQPWARERDRLSTPNLYQDGSTSISTTAALNTIVFSLISTDTEGDSVTYDMTCDPTSCPFTLDGADIKLNADISLYTVVGYDISITAADAKNPTNTVSPKILSVTLTDINDPVLISNLPLGGNLQLSENTALATSVFQVSYLDQDTATQTFSFSMTSTGSGMDFFSIDSSSGQINTASNILNYEAASGETSFTLSITVGDGVTTDTQDLTIDIIDQNEAPSFSQSSFILSATEGTADTVIGTPSFVVNEVDTDKSKTYTNDCGTSAKYFYMDSSSGAVSYQSDYDIDTGLATTVTCTVTVTDSGGLTDTTKLFINIADANDNSPIFSPTSYSFFINYYASTGDQVGTVTASDADAGAYGVITYTIDQTSLLDEYFTIDSSGQLTVNKLPSGLGYATTVGITATVTDAGGLTHTAPVTIVISGTTTLPTTTTSERYRTFIEDTKNIPWLMGCVVTLVVIVVYLGWLAYTCKGDNGFGAMKRACCRRKMQYRPRNGRVRNPSPTRTTPIILTSIRHPPPPKVNQRWRSEK